jgi:hypothetical protein
MLEQDKPEQRRLRQTRLHNGRYRPLRNDVSPRQTSLKTSRAEPHSGIPPVDNATSTTGTHRRDCTVLQVDLFMEGARQSESNMPCGTGDHITDSVRDGNLEGFSAGVLEGNTLFGMEIYEVSTMLTDTYFTR